MQKEFTKADLKDGMVVEYECGTMDLKIGKFIGGTTAHLPLDVFRDDLTNIESDNLDIMKVYKVTGMRTINDIFQKDFLELIWRRTEIKRMTAEEMRVKLEELTGEKIEIEPSREEMVGACYEFCEKQDCLSDCILYRIGNCVFKKYSDERLKECYEKVIADGK